MADIFSAADLVVCLSRDAINRQFAALAQQSLIPDQLLVYRETNPDNSYVFTTVSDPGALPPDAPSICARVCPQIDITTTGTTAILVIRFLPGSSAKFRFPDDASGKLYQLNLEDWSFGVAINADLTSYGKGGLVLPPSVRAELQRFSDDMFDIRHIFLDLDSVDRETSDPATTYVADQRQGVRDAFASFMHFYLKDLKTRGNPFVLGSALLAKPGAVFKDAAGQGVAVPDILAPAGVTFSLFHDAQYPGRSCLCYALATKGGLGTVGSSPPNLVANPIQRDDIDGVIAFSHSVFLEPLVLRPLYEHIRDNVRSQIQGTLSLDSAEYGGAFPSVLAQQPYGTYPPASSFFGGDGGIQAMHETLQEAFERMQRLPPIQWTYTIATARHDDDRYTNNYTVSVQPHDSTLVSLRFDGTIYVFKQHSTSFGLFGEAQAWASVTMPWCATVNIAADSAGNGVTIRIDTTDISQQSKQLSGHNFGASLEAVVDAIGDIAVDLTTSPLSLPGLFSGIGSIGIQNVGQLGSAIQSLGAVAGSSFVMPGGGTFAARLPQIDPMGNYQLDLNIRS